MSERIAFLTGHLAQPRLEKILETVKIQAVEQPKVAATQTAEPGDQTQK